MSVISDLLAQIRTAVYGREVRESIASGIEQCYTDVQSGVTTAETAATAATSAASAANTAASAANTAATNAEWVNISQSKANGIVTITTTNRNNQQTSTTLHDTEIDDASGNGDTDKVWSADKLVKEFIANVPVIDKSISTEAAVQDFADGANGMPMKVVVGIEPVQDLHGFDFPWVGGAGKNLCPATVEFLKSSNTSGASWSGNVCTKGNVTYSVQTDNAGNVIGIVANGSDTSNQAFAVGSTSVPFNLPAGEYVVTGCPASGSTTTYRITVTDAAFNVFARDTGSGASFTLTEQTGIIVFCDIRANYSASDITFKPMIRLASVTDDTFEPYTNICPISGWTGAKITRTRKNEFDKSVMSDATQNNKTYTIQLKANTEYTMSSNCWTGSNAFVLFRLPNETASSRINGIWNGHSHTLTTGSDGQAVVVYRTSGNITNAELLSYDYIIEEGSTSTLQIYHIAFPAEAGTVYGGTLTVNKDGSGTLVVTKMLIELDGSEDEEWGTANNGITSVCKINTALNNNTGAICNRFRHASSNPSNPYAGYFGIGGQTYNLRMNIDGTARTTNEVKTWVASNPIQIVGNIAAGDPIALTPGQVKSLLGYNELWADTGNIKSLEYCVDSKLYIEASIASALMESVASVTETQEVINEYGSDE